MICYNCDECRCEVGVKRASGDKEVMGMNEMADRTLLLT